MLLLATRLQTTPSRLGSLLLVTVTHSEAWTDWTNHIAAVVSISATRFAKSSLRPRQSTWLDVLNVEASLLHLRGGRHPSALQPRGSLGFNGSCIQDASLSDGRGLRIDE